LLDKEHRWIARMLPEASWEQIVMLETALQRFLHDLVVTMIFALSLERLSPSVAILQVAQL